MDSSPPGNEQRTVGGLRTEPLAYESKRAPEKERTTILGVLAAIGFAGVVIVLILLGVIIWVLPWLTR